MYQDEEAQNEPPHQVLRCLQNQLSLSLELKELKWLWIFKCSAPWWFIIMYGPI